MAPTKVLRLLLLLLNMIEGSECKDEKCVESCQENWVENGDHCYYWSTTALNWNDAEDFCTQEGGHLASVTSETTNEFVLSELNGRGNSMLWIGGTSNGTKGAWKWTEDCSPMKFTFWQKNQPSNHEGQDCLRYSRTENNENIFTSRSTSEPKWNDWECNRKQKFLCSQKLCPGSIPTHPARIEPPTTTTTTTTTTKPTAQAKIRIYIYIGMITFVIALTIGGLVFLCRTNCCCFTTSKSKEWVKEDINQIYGTYYYNGGERRTDKMEVRDQNPQYASSFYNESK